MEPTTSTRPYEVTHDASGRPRSERDGPCLCDYNPDTTDGPLEDCPFHGQPYTYWVNAVDTLQPTVDELQARTGGALAEIAKLHHEWGETTPDDDEANLDLYERLGRVLAAAGQPLHP